MRIGERQVEEEVQDNIHDWSSARRVWRLARNLTDFRRHVDRWQEAETRRLLVELQDLADDDRQAIERHGQRLVDIMFHHLAIRIHSLGDHNDIPPDTAARLLARLFAEPEQYRPPRNPLP